MRGHGGARRGTQYKASLDTTKRNPRCASSLHPLQPLRSWPPLRSPRQPMIAIARVPSAGNTTMARTSARAICAPTGRPSTDSAATPSAATSCVAAFAAGRCGTQRGWRSGGPNKRCSGGCTRRRGPTSPLRPRRTPAPCRTARGAQSLAVTTRRATRSVPPAASTRFSTRRGTTSAGRTTRARTTPRRRRRPSKNRSPGPS